MGGPALAEDLVQLDWIERRLALQTRRLVEELSGGIEDPDSDDLLVARDLVHEASDILELPVSQRALDRDLDGPGEDLSFSSQLLAEQSAVVLLLDVAEEGHHDDDRDDERQKELRSGLHEL